MEAHFGQKDSGPPRSIEDEADFQALAGIVRRLEPARQSALMDVLMEDMLTIPPLVWDVPDVVLDVPDIVLDSLDADYVLPEINVTELLKDLDATPNETGQPSRDATKRHPEK
jgi:hypothetical protein